jgi:uncharacterized protein
MAVGRKVQVIDADAHVVETERTWDYLEPSERKFRPLLFSTPDDATRRYWVTDNKIRGLPSRSLTKAQMAALYQTGGRNVDTPEAARQMDDVAVRLKHMDQLGIDRQVVHNTLWIEQVADRRDAEVALCRSWNRWMADIWKQGNARIFWVTVLPYMDIPEAIAQMRFAREHGAVGICVRPYEGNHLITDPYYYPIYEEASRLNMAAVIHIANGNPASSDLNRSPWDGGAAFAMFRAPTVVACHTLLMSDLHRLFPELRWGFIEASAQWIPWIIREAKRRLESAGQFGVADDGTPMNELLSARNIYVTCQTNDDIPYILKEAGLQCLVIGTDYGHIDPSSDIDAITLFRRKFEGMLNEEAVANILENNAKRLYALDY